MKFDKDIILAIAICALILFGWEPFSRYMGWTSKPEATVTTTQKTAVTPQSTTPAAKETVKTSTTNQDAKVTVKKEQLKKYSLQTIANDDLKLLINPNTGDIQSVELLKYKNADRTGIVTINKAADRNGLLELINTKGAFNVVSLKCKTTDKQCTLVRTILVDNKPVQVTQVWELAPKGYVINTKVTFTNLSKEAISFNNLVLTGSNLGPWSIHSGDKVRIPSHRLDYLTSNGDYEDISADKKDAKFFQKPAPMVDWAAASNKYFCFILDSKDPYALYQARYYVNDQKEKDESRPVITIGANLPEFILNGQTSQTFSYSLYSGPKIISELDAFKPSVSKVMHLAWGPLDYLSRLLLWILVKLNNVVNSYGISIIILTILVRTIFYPLTAKGNASMKKMQEIKPQLEEIRTKYKDNPQLLNTKMMELYRVHGVNPFGGCLPILLQIPVFFALYATLDGAVELRQVPFLWCKDLAAADTVATINLYFFNLPINPLVLAMTALMALQQHLTPMAMDPVQKKMMALMPVIMLIFLYDLPSGLTLYWTISNVFSIIQLKLQQRANAAQGTVTETRS
jgi:YidC/Oxa1 family membrane protein insertase